MGCRQPMGDILPALIDTHAHLTEQVFDADRREVLERAWLAGVKAIVSVSENLADARKNLVLAGRHPEIKPAVGLYPAHVDLEQARTMEDMIRAERSRIAAIGEVGLDHWILKDGPDRELQAEIFRLFIDLAAELDLPLNVHSRSAGREAVALLLDKGARRVQLHAFDGKASSALPAVEAGYFFSIPPSVVRSRQKQKLLRQLPLSCLLLETDSPVLGADAEERNEPANLIVALDAIAAMKGESRVRVAEVVLENTLRLYGEGILPRSA
jgi:TatD DNase family protein